jgi:hypothetical protein
MVFLGSPCGFPEKACQCNVNAMRRFKFRVKLYSQIPDRLAAKCPLLFHFITPRQDVALQFVTRRIAENIPHRTLSLWMRSV